jgi:hypothetical protein
LGNTAGLVAGVERVSIKAKYEMPCQLGSICLVRERLVRPGGALILAVDNFSLNHQNNSVH